MNRKKQNCCGCGACSYACPMKCIELKEDEEGFLYPIVNYKNCIDCGKCKSVCPIQNKEKKIKYSIEEKYLAAMNIDESLRLKSSSGGIFILLAKYFLKKKSYVCGAVMSEGITCKHVMSNDLDTIYKMCGSKYIQSNILEVFNDIENNINKNEKILFSGTPCQCAAVKRLFGNDRIITIDLVCKGVPSKIFLLKYVDYIERRFNKKVKDILFRDKSTGWENYSMKFVFRDNTYISINHKNSIFYKLFINNVILRPSCYKCKFRNSRYSDITLGDMWGMKESCSIENDDKGCSLIILNTLEGEKVWSEIESECIYEIVNRHDVLRYNETAFCSPIVHPKRKSIFNKKIDLEEINKFNFIEKINNKLQRGMYKLKKYIKYW